MTAKPSVVKVSSSIERDLPQALLISPDDHREIRRRLVDEFEVLLLCLDTDDVGHDLQEFRQTQLCWGQFQLGGFNARKIQNVSDQHQQVMAALLTSVPSASGDDVNTSSPAIFHSFVSTYSRSRSEALP
ncbi:MAG: hypothetical protein JWO52_1332 [Gammaproteobacteria bacterium]|nr:hypothetical protein [Gammaproteobacteria bacterium]